MKQKTILKTCENMRPSLLSQLSAMVSPVRGVVRLAQTELQHAVFNTTSIEHNPALKSHVSSFGFFTLVFFICCVVYVFVFAVALSSTSYNIDTVTA